MKYLSVARYYLQPFSALSQRPKWFTSSVLTGSFKLGSVKLNKGTVVIRLTVFNFFFFLSSLRANENNQKRTETQT